MLTLTRKNNSESLNKIYDDMTSQFPESERKCRDEFISLFQKDSYRAYEALFEGKSVGYCVICVNEKKSSLWLDYLAVYKDFHSKGFGGKILSCLKDSFPGFKGCFLEVEKPDENDIDTIRRVNFYKKLGALDTCMNYFYPNKDGCLAMDLYFLPYKNPQILEKAQIKDVIKDTFEFLHKNLEHLEAVYKKIL